MKRPFVVIREVREQADQVIETVRDDSSQDADERREQTHKSEPKPGRLLGVANCFSGYERHSNISPSGLPLTNSGHVYLRRRSCSR
jgi:hypothetical protein